MTRLLFLCCWLAAIPGFSQRRTVVREPQRERVYFSPKVSFQGQSTYIVQENDYQKTYTSWANLAERSSQSKQPISLRLSLDSASAQSDWASLRQVRHVHILNVSLPSQVAQVVLDSLLNALANWPELIHIDVSSPRIDLTKPRPVRRGMAYQSKTQLPSVQSANFFGLSDELTASFYLLRHCPVIHRLLINGFGDNKRATRLPPELGQLTSLRTLHLSSGMGFSGLDSAFAGLTNLTTLYMTNTGDGQLLTKTLNHLPQLRKLELRFGITDSDLNRLRLSDLPQLDTLECHFISGTRFPVDSVLAGLPALKSVTLANSHLPSLDWLADHTELRALHLTGCRFPPAHRSLAKLTRLETISIEQADSLGAFPEPFTTLPNLRELSIPDAQIGMLPPGIGALTSLTALNLYHNNLHQLPAELGKLRALTILNLGTNQLSSLPASLFQLPLLENLALYDNHLTSLPTELGQLRQLRNLSLSNNQLTALPGKLVECRKLASLVLDHNPLESLPDALGTLDSLQMLYLGSTRLRALPASVGRLKKLHTLDLSGGHLTVLPASLGDCQSLTSLTVDDSTLTTLPNSLTGLLHLSNLWLGLPQVRTLPNGLMQLPELEKLTLSMPRLALLPDNLGDLRKLTEMHLFCHQLLGLPNSIGRLTQLTDLAIVGGTNPTTNQPTGVLEQLPDSIALCTNLKKVAISEQQAFDGADAIQKLARLPLLNTVRMIYCGLNDLRGIDWKQVLFNTLSMEGNSLRDVPNSILEAPNLRTLNLLGNPLLPASLSQTFWNKETLRKALDAVEK